MYRLFSLLFIILGYIPEYLLIEVNSGNCVSNTVIYSQCKFSIKIIPPLKADLMCQLKFTNTNITTAVLVNNGSILSSKIGNSCPSISMIIYNGSYNENAVSCGNSFMNYNQTYPGYVFGKFVYTNNVVEDLTTNINMEIYLLGLRDCVDVKPTQSSSSKIIWILIIICALVLIVIIAVIIAIDCMRKHPQKKTNQQQQLVGSEAFNIKHDSKLEDGKASGQEALPILNETSA